MMTNKTFFLKAAMLALMATSIMGCQKEFPTSPASCGTAVTASYCIRYHIDNDEYYTVLNDEQALSDFIDRMTALALKGHRVNYRCINRNDTSCTKEKVTFTTTNSDDAKRWCKEKTMEGYDVTMLFDQETGVYTCIAVK